MCDNSNESNRAVLSCGAVFHFVQDGLTFIAEKEILKCDHSNESYGAYLTPVVLFSYAV